MSPIASARVALLRRNIPRTAEVTVSLPGFFTPRMLMHRCSASMTTKTPRGFNARSMASAIWVVSRSCTWGLLEVDQAGEFGEPRYVTLLVRDVGHVRPADKRHEVVLANRVQGDVAHHDHLVVIGLEGDVQLGGGIVPDPREYLLVHVGDPLGSAQESVPVGILADRFQDDSHRSDDRLAVETPPGMELAQHVGGLCHTGTNAEAGLVLPHAAGGRSDLHRPPEERECD
jgi:hypothetical protein